MNRGFLDPRTKLALVLATSLTVMAPGGLIFVPAALLLGVALAATERAWRRLIILPAAALGLAGVAYLLPPVAPHPAIGALGVAAAYFLRFVAVGGVAAHLIASTPPAELTAALRAVRVPRVVTVPTAVMLRFVPVITAEAAAVHDAMRLRGIGGWAGLVRHPVRSIERFTVPVIAASLRVGEDLSAAALLRGLGSRHRPTSMRPPRFGPADLLLLILVAGAVSATLLWARP
ncbi:energy-coupling factor transporter transmembrane component T [Microlunatus parietis]|uniref:Energy-coupling factor transport system permease protein n=1 Tax=Microlunatus parietis TaxID=682979 RepID=A0A7Y9L7I1_9ACTN|nr:energy-coupling factor transporter transmembrane component T [Microlunatus parietis]NYE69809.1 energy-coupling factor transport system permease protein [Microlunatus parietis]